MPDRPPHKGEVIVECDAMADPYNLKHFLDAQAPVIEEVRSELCAAALNREFRRLSIAGP